MPFYLSLPSCPALLTYDSAMEYFVIQARHPVPPEAGSVPTASTSVTVLAIMHVVKTMVTVAQAVTRTGLDLPVNTVSRVKYKIIHY